MDPKPSLILVDTSVWIDFLAKGTSASSHLLEESIKTDSVCMTPLIRAEILSGARNDKEYNLLASTLSGVKILSEPGEFWDRLARYHYLLSRRGFQVLIPDLSIAIYAHFHGCPLLTADKAFRKIAQVVPIKVL